LGKKTKKKEEDNLVEKKREKTCQTKKGEKRGKNEKINVRKATVVSPCILEYYLTSYGAHRLLYCGQVFLFFIKNYTYKLFQCIFVVLKI